VKTLGLLIVLSLVIGAAAASAAERRVALVIGNSAYRNAAPLANPGGDATAVGVALERLGFEVEVALDADQLRMRGAVRELGIRAEQADVALVFYAGHGIQVGGQNFLLPVDARLARERDLLYEALPLELILEEVAQAGKLGLVLLDACRDNPLAEQLRDALGPLRVNQIGRGLARVEVLPSNTLVAFSTRPGDVAVDGTGERSPYTAALLQHIEAPGLELGLLLRKVRDTVLAITANRQEPRDYSALGAEPFYFKERRPNRRPEQPALAPLRAADDAGPTPLGIAPPHDPDADPLSIQVAGLPERGMVEVGERALILGDVLTADDLPRATYTPMVGVTGRVGSFDFLVKDGRGGVAVGRVPITVESSNRPPVIGTAAVAALPEIPLRIPPTADPDGDPLTVMVDEVPRLGAVRSGERTLRPGDQIAPQELVGLVLLPGAEGAQGTFAFTVADSRGASASSAIVVPTIVLQRAQSGGPEPERQDMPSAVVSQAHPPMPEAKPPEAAPGRNFVAARQVYETIRPSNIRAAPSSEAEQVTTVDTAATLHLIGRAEDRDWLQVTTEGGLEGYIYAQLVRPKAQPAEPRVDRLQASAAQAQPAAATVAAASAPGFKECAACPEMVMIRPGRFQMGSADGHWSERPVRWVNVGEPFALGKYEVTVGEWQACVDAGGCRTRPDMRGVSDDSPVHNLSWEDAQAYAAWLREHTGKPYRLPTEAEWEYAARAGATTAFWWGDDPGSAQANCNDCGGAWSFQTPADVGAFAPNPFGLHGMHGGVMEWVEDCWFEDYQGAPSDSAARAAANCAERVLRGGSWRDDATYATASSRLGYDAGVRYETNGLRIARDPN
jgi:formylglycine-generating enzyme required for sulfatase activity